MLNMRQAIRAETDLSVLANHETRFMADIARSNIIHGIDNRETKSLLQEVHERISYVADSAQSRT